MLPVGFEPTVSADERPQTYALDRAATGTGSLGLAIARYLRQRVLHFYPFNGVGKPTACTELQNRTVHRRQYH